MKKVKILLKLALVMTVAVVGLAPAPDSRAYLPHCGDCSHFTSCPCYCDLNSNGWVDPGEHFNCDDNPCSW